MQEKNIKIVGTGFYLPGKPISINEVDNILGIPEEAPKKILKWLGRTKDLMEQMLEVDYYYFAISPVTKKFVDDNISMSVKSAKMAIDNAKLKAQDIDFISYGSAQQDQMPTTSVRIQEELGIDDCAEISIHANCTSAYKAFMTAHDYLAMGRGKTALVISSNMSSSELRAEFYNQKIVKKEELFLRYFLSDGAGAVILQAEDESTKSALYINQIYSESAGCNKPAGMLTKRPSFKLNPKEIYENGYHHLAQMYNDQLSEHFHEENGTVFYNGLKRMIDTYNLDLSDLKFFQINFPSKHISELVMDECESLGIDRNTLYTKISSMGYVGPPMVFICLHKIFTEERLKNGDLILSFVTEVSKFMQAGFLLQYHK